MPEGTEIHIEQAWRTRKNYIICISFKWSIFYSIFFLLS